MEYLRKFTLYKPNKSVTGSALQISLMLPKDGRDGAMFFEFANELKDKPKTFDWSKENKLTMKMGEADISKMLLCIKDATPVDVMHKTEKSSSSISMKKAPDGRAFFVNASRRDGEKTLSVRISIQPDEAELLRLTLETGFTRMLGW